VKKLLTICTFLFALPLFAHEGDMDNTQGLFGIPPEYIHVLINPLPTYGLIVGIVVLFVGLVARSVTTRNIGGVIVLVCTGIVWAVVHYGQHAYNHLYMDLDAASKKWADVHMDRGESFAWVFYATALLSLIALFVPKYSKASVSTENPQPEKRAQIPIRPLSSVGTIFAVIVLIAAIISFGLGTWISRAGGRVRHPEFREGPPPAHAAETEEHHHH
jgi:hypothetical protein